VLSSHRSMYILRVVVACALAGLTGCGSGSRPMNSGNFSATVASPGDRATGALTSSPGVANVTLSPAHLVGGGLTEITVHLTQPAPDGGVDVQLKSSDASVVAPPASVRISSGQTSATVEASTSPVAAATTVAISALYGNTVGGTSLEVGIGGAAKAAFTVVVKPATVTIAAGHSGSAKVKTTVTNGYDQALQLSVLNLPAGVSVTLTPAVIPAPGAGTSKAKITVAKSAAPGTYALPVTASDGTTSHSATLTLNVASSGPGATFQGCWYQKSGHRYQGVKVTVANPGTYPFDAVLYHGAACNPDNWADEFEFGTPLYFGDFLWTFWFTDFSDQSDTSAIWYVGSDKSQCVSYAVAPDC
jgi:hypothetical protein